MLDSSGTAFLSDFGLAKRIADVQPGEVRGSPLFLSPEKAEAAKEGMEYKATAADDIWALGAILYMLASGGKHYLQDWAHADPKGMDPDEQVKKVRTFNLRCLPAWPLTLLPPCTLFR